MPEGRVQSYDAERKRGKITPEDGEESIPFEADDVVDRRPGEALETGLRVTYKVEGGKAVEVHQIGKQGYG